MKLGIIGALDVEVETLIAKMEHPVCTEHAGSKFYDGTLEGLPVAVVECGVGKVNAAVCTQILCDLYGITHLVNTGIAGSLCAELDIGDLVVSRDVMYHDFDCTAFSYAYGQVPGTDAAAFPADETLMAYAFAAADQQHIGHARIGRIASGDQFISSAEAKAAIIEKTQALCTEMESAAIAQTARRNGVPFAILRAISDKADNSAQMDYPTFEAMIARRCAAVTLSLVKVLWESLENP